MTEEIRNALVQRNDRLIRDVIQKAEKECKSAGSLCAESGEESTDPGRPQGHAGRDGEQLAAQNTPCGERERRVFRV